MKRKEYLSKERGSPDDDYDTRPKGNIAQKKSEIFSFDTHSATTNKINQRGGVTRAAADEDRGKNIYLDERACARVRCLELHQSERKLSRRQAAGLILQDALNDRHYSAHIRGRARFCLLAHLSSVSHLGQNLGHQYPESQLKRLLSTKLTKTRRILGRRCIGHAMIIYDSGFFRLLMVSASRPMCQVDGAYTK